MQFQRALLAAAALALATQAQAAETLFGNRAGFEATLATSVTDTYSNPGYVFIQSNAAMSAVLGETDYQSTGFSNLNIVAGGYYCAGCNGSFILSFGTTSVTDGNGVFGVGFEFANSGGFFDALVTFGDGATQLFDLGAAGFRPSTFWGLTSTRQISSISFGPGGGTTQSGSFGIDNLTIGSAPSGVVPEPAAWALMISGFGLVGAAARRRRTVVAA
jgi:hypothetical protein